jgi:DNA processing protein
VKSKLTIKLEELKALIALKMCDGIGDISAHKLLSYYGSAAAVFEEKRQHLSCIPGISPNIGEWIHTGINWPDVEKEVAFINKNRVNHVSILDRDYPQKLVQTDAPPPVLFFKGSIEPLNSYKCISIVGTRAPTRYGQEVVEQIINELKDRGVIVVSGLALGIDIAAHKECIQNKLITYGIVGHGLQTIYPREHYPFAQQMIDSGGGIITEFFSGVIPNRENFPKRNRIIAGLSSATLVIEASKKSGTLITAHYALAYKRKVFALPGRYNDKYSEGCNFLLSTPSVKPILSIPDLMDELGLGKKLKPVQPKPDVALDLDELVLMKIFAHTSRINLDEMTSRSQLNLTKCTAALFNLELKGLIKSLPGKLYELC